MRKFFVWLLIAILIGFGLIFLLLYQFAGLGQYLKIKAEIRQLPSEQAETATNIFNGAELDSEYRGVLGYIDQSDEGEILVWGRSGPRYFKADEYTAYSFFNACTEDILSAQPEDGAIPVQRNVHNDVREWAREVQVGDFVSILLTMEGQGGTVGNLREVWAHDWYYFLPKDLRELCKE
jgi:hypothetical protein